MAGDPSSTTRGNQPITATASRHEEKVWVGLDQIASSATNFGAAALLAGLLTAEGFGATSVAFAIYVLVMGVGRAWCYEPVVLRSSHVARVEQRAAMAAALGASSTLGAGAGLLLAASSFTFGGDLRAALLALAVCLPGLLAHDTVRGALIMANKSRVAFESDLLWMILSTSALIVLRRLDYQSVALGMLSWAGAGVAAAVYGIARLGARPSYRLVNWIRQVGRIGWSTTAEFGLLQLSNSMNLVLLTALTADLALTGAYRGAQVILGPTAMCVSAVSLYTRPGMARAHYEGARVDMVARRATGVCAAAWAAWLAFALMIPRSVGIRLFGATWDGAIDLVPIVSLMFLALAITAMPVDAIRSTGRFAVVLQVRAAIALLVVTGTLVGARLLEERGAITGFAWSSLLGGAVAWWALYRSTDRAVRSTAG